MSEKLELRLGKPVCERRGGRVVYRGGLENRFGLTPDGGSNPSLSASPEGFRGCRSNPAWREKAGRAYGANAASYGPASQKNL